MVDVAIQGDGFFVVNTTNGEAYTRDGSFTIDRNGNLVTKEGYSVMGENGAITFGEEFLTEGGNIVIKENGDVYLDGAYIDRLSMANFENTRSLTKMNDNLYTSNGARSQFTGSIRPWGCGAVTSPPGAWPRDERRRVSRLQRRLDGRSGRP